MSKPRPAAYNLVTTIKYVNYYYDNINRVYFDLPWQQWSLLNRFCMEQGHVVTVEGNDDLQTLICVLAARLRQCPTLSNPVLSQS